MSIIKLTGVSKQYEISSKEKIVVFNDLNFEVEDKDFVAIIGKSGSGKSTFLNLIGGLDRKFKGKIEVMGHNLSKLNDREISQFRNKHIGFIFQSFYLLPHLTCGENIALPSLFSLKKEIEDIDKQISVCLDSVGLKDKKNVYPTQLSGGQRQRIAIARALFLDPEIILCDEPTGNLDHETGLNVLDIVKRLNEERGITILMVTHEEHIKEKARKVVKLKDGQLNLIDNVGV